MQSSTAVKSTVKVSFQKNSGQLELEVSDQGIGFDVAYTRKSGGLGLVSMAERIYQVNGTLSIDSRPNAGTRIRDVFHSPHHPLPQIDAALFAKRVKLRR